LEQFADYGQYQEALIDYRVQAQLSQVVARSTAQQAVAAFQAKAVTASDRPEDYQETIARVMSDRTLPISNAMAEVILGDAVGPDIAYYLGANPAELRRIASLSEGRQAAELGRIAVRFESAPLKRVSSAPQPHKPVRTGSASVAKKPDEMTQAEYNRWRSKQIASKRS
jgi:hypothetical protein